MSAQTLVTVSIVVCTYNRCESLRETLQSLIGQSVSQNRAFEIVIVDNNSTDATRRTVQNITESSCWPIRYIFESCQGLSYARNAGIQASRGEILAFVDDDVIVEPLWLQGLLDCFQATGCDVIGGRVTMLWNCARPLWLVNGLHGPLISQDLGSQRQRWPYKDRFMLGVNMAFRRDVFERLGLFQEGLGRRGQALIGGEDREMFERLMRADSVVFYEPKAAVSHKVESQRVTPEYYRRWYTDIGYTQAHQLSWKWHYRYSVMPAWRWIKLVRAGLRYAKAQMIRTSFSLRFQAELWWTFECSFLKERLDHWIGRKPCHFAKA